MLCRLFPHWHWQVLELPPRHFSWRVRGNPLYWSVQERDTLEAEYDVILATSMVDLATLRGLVPSLASVRTLLYFHENQFAYPQGNNNASIVEPQMVSLYSALAADELFFNSQFNQDSFLSGCAELLKKLPDYVPQGIVETLLAKSNVVAVPVSNPCVETLKRDWPGMPRNQHRHPLRLAWLGRFEYDKAPGRLLSILRALEDRQLDYELAVVGQQFRSLPPAFETIAKDYAHRLVHIGYIEEEEAFLGFLTEVDIALSTALHEFQGLALIQAAAAGAVPVVPDRQAYPEVFPSQFLYTSDLEDNSLEARSAADKIASLSAGIRSGEIVAPDVSRFLPEHMASVYSFYLEG